MDTRLPLCGAGARPQTPKDPSALSPRWPLCWAFLLLTASAQFFDHKPHPFGLGGIKPCGRAAALRPPPTAASPLLRRPQTLKSGVSSGVPTSAGAVLMRTGNFIGLLPQFSFPSRPVGARGADYGPPSAAAAVW